MINERFKLSFLNSQLSFDYGGLAQLARAPALHAGGQRFESVILHPTRKSKRSMTYWTKQKVIFFSTSWKYISPAQLTDVSSVNDKKESRKGHMADALALGGDEGRDKLR